MNLIAKFQESTDRLNTKEKDTLNKLKDPKPNRIRQIIDLNKARLDYDTTIQQIEANIIRKIRNKQASAFVGLGSHGRISKSTKGQSLQPVKVLEIPGKGGTITADENKVDEIARNAWKQISMVTSVIKMRSSKTSLRNTKITSTKVTSLRLTILTGKILKLHARTLSLRVVSTHGQKRSSTCFRMKLSNG